MRILLLHEQQRRTEIGDAPAQNGQPDDLGVLRPILSYLNMLGRGTDDIYCCVDELLRVFDGLHHLSVHHCPLGRRSYSAAKVHHDKVLSLRAWLEMS